MSEHADVKTQRLKGRVAAVVVGFDGSRGATDALRWAFAEASLR